MSETVFRDCIRTCLSAYSHTRDVSDATNANRFYGLSLHTDFRHISLIGRLLGIIGLKTAFSFASAPAFSYICTKICIGNYDRYSQKSDYRFLEHRRPAILFGAGVALRTQSHEQRHRSNPRQQPKEHDTMRSMSPIFGSSISQSSRKSGCLKKCSTPS